MKKFINKIYDFTNNTKTGKVLYAFCLPILISWIICFLVYGIPLTKAVTGIKGFVVLISLISGCFMLIHIINKEEDDNYPPNY